MVNWKRLGYDALAVATPVVASVVHDRLGIKDPWVYAQYVPTAVAAGLSAVESEKDRAIAEGRILTTKDKQKAFGSGALGWSGAVAAFTNASEVLDKWGIGVVNEYLSRITPAWGKTDFPGKVDPYLSGAALAVGYARNIPRIARRAGEYVSGLRRAA